MSVMRAYYISQYVPNPLMTNIAAAQKRRPMGPLSEKITNYSKDGIKETCYAILRMLTRHLAITKFHYRALFAC